METKQKLTAAEAVYGFAAWLTTRKERTIMSASDDSAPIAELVKQFCSENHLESPRVGWENNLIHPDGQCSGPTCTENMQENADGTYSPAISM